MSAPNDDTLRALLAEAPSGPWTVEQMGDDSWALIRPAACECGQDGCHLGFERVDRYEACSRLTVHAPALAAEVLRLRARAEKAEAERDAIRAAADQYARSHARRGGDL